MPMNPQVKEKWVEALTNGTYKQAQGALQHDGELVDGTLGVGYCCLGVLCDLYVKENPKNPHGARWEDGAFKFFDEKLGRSRSEGDLPPGFVYKWAGLDVEDGSAPYVGISVEEAEGYGLVDESESLAVLNDEGWTFKDIAEKIREQL